MRSIILTQNKDKEARKAAQNFYNKQNDDVKNVLALAAEEISNFLPHTLTKNCNEKYGLDEKHIADASPSPLQQLTRQIQDPISLTLISR